MRPIDAHALSDKAEEMYIHTSSGTIIPVMAVPAWAINNAPTIEVEPVRHGVWTTMVRTDTGEFAGYKCSECGMVEYRNYDRCRCGAIMDGGAEE